MSEPLWIRELRWLSRQPRPAWGGPVKRGELDKLLRSDRNLSMMLTRGYVEIIPNEGFVATAIGREFVGESIDRKPEGEGA